MSEELGFIASALERIENKIDSGLKDHGDRISRLEGGVSGLRWAVGTLISAAAIIAALAYTAA